MASLSLQSLNGGRTSKPSGGAAIGGLAGSQSRLLLPLANCADGFYAVDADQRIIAWNEAAEAILGHRAEDVLGKPCYEVLPGRDGSGSLVCRFRCLDCRLAEQREIVPGRDMRTLTADGQPVWISLTNIVLYSEYDELICVGHVFRDVTAAKRLEEMGGRLALLLEEYGLYPENGNGGPRIRPAVERRLSNREREVLVLLTSGASARQVAESLVISDFTARKHIQNILTKLNVHSIREAVALAIQEGARGGGSSDETGVRGLAAPFVQGAQAPAAAPQWDHGPF